MTARRLVDVVVAVVGLGATSPLTAVAALAIRATMGRPVLFYEERAGLSARPFRLVKLRTMRPASSSEQGPESDGQRITRVGRWLRANSLDELPSLWNVLCGDMSLVGPRPLPVRYLDRYTPEQSRRHEVKPGITGLAQVKGRNALSWDDKLSLDVWYVEHRSARLDTRILLLTVSKVLLREGISQGSHATMPEFTGAPRAGA